MWEGDGWGWRARIGLLIPHADLNPEAELTAMAPEGVSIHGARVPFGAMRRGGVMDPTIPLAPLRAIVEPPDIDDAAELLADAPLSVIGFVFTSSSYVTSEKDDIELAARLQGRTGDIPVLITGLCALDALRALGTDRLAIIDPPWFDDELNDGGRQYFTDAGIEVVHASSAGVPSSQKDIHPGAVYEWAKANVPAHADAVFFGGNGFRTVGLINALEEDMGVPVLTANQVVLWRALKVAGVNAQVERYGRLFAA